MTREKLMEKLREFEEQGVRHVTDDEGKSIKSVCDPEESKNYIVLNTSYDEDGSLTVKELISRLKECHGRKFVINEWGSEIIDAIYECLIEPTVVLLEA